MLAARRARRGRRRTRGVQPGGHRGACSGTIAETGARELAPAEKTPDGTTPSVSHRGRCRRPGSTSRSEHAGGSALKAISTKGAGANANILIVNNDTSYPLLVKPDQSNIWSTAEIYVINSSVGCVDTNPALNGYVIGEGGSWAGSPAILNRGDSISIAPCGAALVEIQH